LEFAHLTFRGKTTSPWHVGKRGYSNYLYTRRDILWGRGVRGPILRQLWRTHCPRSDARERVEFDEEKDCRTCVSAPDCPFYNLRGSGDEGEFKDKPRLIVSNLRFLGEFEVRRIALAVVDDKLKSAIPGKAPIYVEYVPPGVGFLFEVILMAEGVRFEREVVEAAKVSLKFHGWGAFCNEGFGRGEMVEVKRRGFSEFEQDILKPAADMMPSSGKIFFEITPLLILDKDGGGNYTSTLEEGFQNKLCNSINERYWQFYNTHVHTQESVKEVFGRSRTLKIRGWSMKRVRSNMSFEGIGGELVFEVEGLSREQATALTLASYGVGRYKNQGFGSLTTKGGEGKTATL